jgi:hypothetical protein
MRVASRQLRRSALCCLKSKAPCATNMAARMIRLWWVLKSVSFVLISGKSKLVFLSLAGRQPALVVCCHPTCGCQSCGSEPLVHPVPFSFRKLNQGITRDQDASPYPPRL